MKISTFIDKNKLVMFCNSVASLIFEIVKTRFIKKEPFLTTDYGSV